MFLKLYLKLKATKHRIFIVSSQKNTVKTLFSLINEAKKDFNYLDDNDIIVGGPATVEILKGYSYVFFDLNLIDEKELKDYFMLSLNENENLVL